jgi:DNA-binding NarL/FixJ family response regulator
MGNFEELDALENIAWQITDLKQQRTELIVKALLAGHSQRSVASSGGISVNTVRSIMEDRHVVHSGEKYSISG